MGQDAQKTFFTAADYLAWEPAQLDRHEYIGGEVFSMEGAEDRHATVAGNLYIALRQRLGGSPCRTYMSNMRLHVIATNSYFTPMCWDLQRARRGQPDGQDRAQADCGSAVTQHRRL